MEEPQQPASQASDPPASGWRVFATFDRAIAAANLVATTVIAALALWIGHQYQLEGNRRADEQSRLQKGRAEFEDLVSCLNTQLAVRSYLDSAGNPADKVRAINGAVRLARLCARSGIAMFDSELHARLVRMSTDRSPQVAATAQHAISVIRAEAMGVPASGTAVAPEVVAPGFDSPQALLEEFLRRDRATFTGPVQSDWPPGRSFRYRDGSLSNVSIGFPERPGYEDSIRGEFLYSDGGSGWVVLQFSQGIPYCVIYSHSPMRCRNVRRHYASDPRFRIADLDLFR